jgi:hypothetical protein
VFLVVAGLGIVAEHQRNTTGARWARAGAPDPAADASWAACMRAIAAPDTLDLLLGGRP